MEEFRSTISSMAVARELQIVSADVRFIWTRDRNGLITIFRLESVMMKGLEWNGKWNQSIRDFFCILDVLSKKKR